MKDKTPFEAYKAEFKETTGRNWNDSISDYIAFMQLKVQEQQLVALNELCSTCNTIVTKITPK